MKKFITKYYFLVLPLVVTAIMLIQNIAYYQVDDRFMMEMANSFKTNPNSEHIMFINVLFGYGLKFLYGIFPAVNWFSVMYVVTVNLAFIPMYRITRNYNYKVIFAGIVVILQMLSFAFITFTFLAFICATAAVLWSLENVKQINKKAIGHLIISFLLFCLGFGMRAGNTFVFVVLVFLPVYLFAILKKRNSPWVIITLIAITVIANYGMIGIQKEYKKTIPEETYFNQFQTYRAIISDDIEFDYEEKKELFDSMGISDNDIKLYKSWKYADKQVFSKEHLKTIVDSNTVNDKYTLNPLEFESGISVKLATVVYVILAIICMIIFRKNWKEILLFSTFVLGAILYLHIRRRAPFRVVLPMIVLSVSALWYIVLQEVKNGFEFKSFHKNLLYPLIGIVILGTCGYNVLHVAENKRSEQISQKITEYTSADKTKIYLTDESGEFTFLPYVLSLRAPEDTSSRPCNIFGDWFVYSYFWYDRLEELGLTEYQDCTFRAVLAENVRMVYGENTTNLDRICLFLKEHYDLDVGYQIEDAIDGTNYLVYDFYVVN